MLQVMNSVLTPQYTLVLLYIKSTSGLFSIE